MVAVVVAGLSAHGSTSGAAAGVAPLPTPAGAKIGPAAAYLPFDNLDQVAAAKARVLSLLQAEASRRGPLLQSAPRTTPPPTPAPRQGLVPLQVQFAVGPDSGIFSVLVSDPWQYRTRYGPSFSSAAGPCRQGGMSLDHCVRAPYTRGVVVWTYDESVTMSDATVGDGPPRVIQRYAVVLHPDGSVLSLTYSLEGGDQPGGSLDFRTLPSAGTPTAAELTRLALQLATAWQGASADAVSVPATSLPVPSATIGPPRATSFAFPASPRAVAPRQTPTSGTCAAIQGDAVTFQVGKDGTLSPSCAEAIDSAQLYVINRSSVSVTVELGSHTITVGAGKRYGGHGFLLDEFLENGVHDLTVVGGPKAELWIDPPG